jgi:hypothetical protein
MRESVKISFHSPIYAGASVGMGINLKFDRLDCRCADFAGMSALKRIAGY